MSSERVVKKQQVAVPNNDEDTDWGRAIEQREIPQARPDESFKIDEQVDIAIVGAGLVGLAVAIGLSVAGIDCRVYERAPRLRSESQGMLAVVPNGRAALEAIHPDIPDLVAKLGCEHKVSQETSIFANELVEDTASPNRGDEMLKKYGTHQFLISWNNMQQVLASLLPPGLVRTSRSLSYFVEEEDSVLVHFENGSVIRAKAVLACDGIFSAARRQMFPNDDDDSPIFFGQLNWASIIETSKLPPNLHQPNAIRYITCDGGGDDDDTTTRWMSMLNDCGSGYTFWQIRLADPKRAMALSGNNGRGGLGLPGAKEKLLSIASCCEDVAAAIRGIPESQIFERSIVGRYPLPTWLSQGSRVALVGDSAHGMHPNIGQGANSGFCSAAAVVQSIIRHKDDGDWKAALIEYQETRKARADVVQRFANAMGVLQATGKELLPRTLIDDTIHWTRKNDPDMDPPKEVVDILENFDPCNEPGVSLLW